MRKTNIFCVFVSLFAALCAAHPTFYNLTLEDDVSCHEPNPARIRSWHIHVLYWGTNKESVASAQDLKERFKAAFNETLGPDCEGLTHNDRMCMLEDSPVPGGPFLTGQWAVYIMPEHF